jgi:hypothetical protein
VNGSFDAVEVTALDLSYIGKAPEQFDVSTKYIIINDIQEFNQVLKIIQMNIDLSQPWNSSLIFSNAPITATSNSVGTQQQLNNTKVELITYKNILVQKVTADDVYTLVTQNATSWGLSTHGKLVGKTYVFDGDGFHLGSTDSGDVATHTNTYSKWIHGSNYSIAKSSGFFICFA